MESSSLLTSMFGSVPGTPGTNGATHAASPNLTAREVKPVFNGVYAGVVAEGWLSISSPIFKDQSKFPIYNHPDGTGDILTSTDYTRINEKFKDLPVDQVSHSSTDKNGPPTRSSFYFRLSRQFIYFAESKECSNVLGSLDFVHSVDPNSIHFEDAECFVAIEKSGNKWKYCAANNEDAKKFLCQMQTILRITPDQYCNGKVPEIVTPITPPPPKAGEIVEKIITQPYILIPLAREMCNQNWNYESHGSDWKCLCKEGLEQSPIDLPPVDHAIGSPVKALFNFDKISNIADEDFEDKVKSGDNLRLSYEDGALRMFSSYFGKTVTMDGGVFHAQQISFHTPSEHKINGEEFPMEMQVLHVGKTIGDTAKHLVLSFLFKKSAGVYNKFLEAIDFFNLPNPYDKIRDLEKSIFLPNIHFQVNEDEPSIMTPFSFYTYSGSLTAPPCNEKTIHYVASEPIGVSSTVIELFKEALRIPDLQDSNGSIIQNNDSILVSNRETQKLNGRPVFHYNHKKYSCPIFKRLKAHSNIEAQKQGGHYERRSSEATNYFFVEGVEPSGLPGAFVVTKKEAVENDA